MMPYLATFFLSLALSTWALSIGFDLYLSTKILLPSKEWECAKRSTLKECNLYEKLPSPKP